MTTDVDKAPTFVPSTIAYVEDPARPVLTHARTLQAGASVPSYSGGLAACIVVSYRDFLYSDLL